MKQTIFIAFIGLTLLLAFAAGSQAAGPDIVIKSSNGICQLSVPAGWAPGELPGMAQSPDKQMTALVSSPKMIDSFSQLKQAARTMYSKSKVTKDTASELEMEGQSATDKPDVYRAIPISGTTFCIAEVQYPGGPATAAKTIVETLKSAK